MLTAKFEISGLRIEIFRERIQPHVEEERMERFKFMILTSTRFELGDVKKTKTKKRKQKQHKKGGIRKRIFLHKTMKTLPTNHADT